MDIIGIAGLLVSIAGFALSLWQLARTRRAAEAALAASIDTARAIRMVHALTDIEQICGRSRDLLNLIREESVRAAATEALEVRNLMAKFYATQAGRLLTSAAVWAELQGQVTRIHERLESALVFEPLEPNERESLLLDVSQVYTKLSSIAATTAESGRHHVNAN